ncbi:hypothetical protein COY93_02015 [Candidatus Uhrbacteria bacterium CG_4_10_14_0_8_um_filter_58_22]|uniref:Uncharacterized protein n=1 Tax=Candidatus Uhrbacteria bacterium CG_4_10_14_0_8_um_filter_58_22 TaxID=1975029 RepID=A0A2M7QB98_9BACT|nr:MAG: hypothetical protein AUJ19_02900 [Parcubacteria group bacterium CG1_02_58_44]PIY62865.1 MAG: hypothetical protein COY93_02015 [Candidatus Uhrbacteria bacterium CG_4_10_14_0_8_um_filter_58_22]
MGKEAEGREQTEAVYEEKKIEGRQPKKMNGIWFVWVPSCVEMGFREHWLSVSGRRVRVFEPLSTEDNWSVSCHSTDDHNPNPNPDTYFETERFESRTEAFDCAEQWTRHGSPDPV